LLKQSYQQEEWSGRCYSNCTHLKVRDKAALVPDWQHLGVLDGRQTVSNDAQTTDAKGQEAAHIGVMQGHLDALIVIPEAAWAIEQHTPDSQQVAQGQLVAKGCKRSTGEQAQPSVKVSTEVTLNNGCSTWCPMTVLLLPVPNQDLAAHVCIHACCKPP